MASDDIVQEIKDRIDIVDLVSRYVSLERAGSRMRARCPFHEETDPSFYVDPEAKFWKCFGCGKGGDVFSFVMEIEGLTFPEAGERLADMVGLQWKSSPRAERASQERNLVRQANEYAAEFFKQCLSSPAGQHARQYLLNRGINAESIEKFGLGYAPDSWDAMLKHLTGRGIQPPMASRAGLVKPRASGGFYDTFRNRIMFPIEHVSGYTVGFGGRALDPEESAKYINSPETPLFKKSRTVYGLNHARQMIHDRNLVLVVEGYTDVISLAQAGIENVVACLGTATTSEHLQLLSRYADEICFIYDADAAGMQAALRHIDVFEGASADVKVAVLTKDQDPDEAVQQLGPEGFLKIVDDRLSLVEYQLRMIFEEHSGQSGGDRAAAAREAVQVLAKVKDAARCDAFLAQAADWWGEGNPARTEAMERVLTQELNRLVGSRRRRRRRVPLSARDKQFISDAIIRVVEREPRGLLKNEADILSAAMNDIELATILCPNMQPDHFVDGLNAVIFRRLSEHFEAEGAYMPHEMIDRLPEEDGVRQRAIELWLRSSVFVCQQDEDDENGEQNSEPQDEAAQRKKEFAEVLQQHIANVERYRIENDLQDQQQSIAEAINRGELTPDSPEYQQYLRQQSQRAGVNDRRKGFWGVNPEQIKNSKGDNKSETESLTDEGS
ncbi:MAG: DNA primase [Armatimonadota bacterium]